MSELSSERSSSIDRAWSVRSATPEERAEAVELGSKLGLHPLIAHLLRQRELNDIDAMDRFVKAPLSDLPEPTRLLDCDRAARRILDALDARQQIVVYGDYDVDGVTSSALLWRYFWEAFGVDLSVYIPNRLTEGYGLNADAVERLASEGVKLLITVDNGSAAIEEVELARSLGVDVIIIDHHVVSDPEPPAFAHLNPQRIACEYPDKRLAAVGVAFMLLVHLRRVTRDDERFRGARSPNLSQLLDIVALGTVADVATLQGVNRALVKFGVASMRRAPRAGVRALMQLARVSLEDFSARDIAYKLGPRLNAAGRIDDARCGLQLLINDNPRFTSQLATHVEQFNQERRALQDQVAREALELAEAFVDEPVIVVASPHWHHGVVGIVASRVMETYHRPAVVLGGDQVGGELLFKGSARSLPELNIKAALDQCADHLISYGGHAAAAGMSLSVDALDAFRSALIETIKRAGHELFDRPPIIADAELSLTDVNADLLTQLEALEPLGHGNPEPLFVTRGVTGRVSTLSSGKHLKIHFNLPPGLPAEAVGWRMGHLASSCDGPLDICYQPSWNTFKGVRKIVLTLKELRPAQRGELSVISSADTPANILADTSPDMTADTSPDVATADVPLTTITNRVADTAIADSTPELAQRPEPDQGGLT